MLFTMVNLIFLTLILLCNCHKCLCWSINNINNYPNIGIDSKYCISKISLLINDNEARNLYIRGGANVNLKSKSSKKLTFSKMIKSFWISLLNPGESRSAVDEDKDKKQDKKSIKETNTGKKKYSFKGKGGKLGNK